MHDVVLIPGDGIGPEISKSVTKILDEAGADINWIKRQAGIAGQDETGSPLPDETVEAVDKYKVALKGPLTTPVGSGFRSINVTLRKKFNLYSNVRPAQTLPNIKTPFDDVDIVMFRENTEGLYIGYENWKDEEKNHAESIAVVTRKASENIIRAAFEYARQRDRDKVTLAHKANILKLTSGLFLEVGKQIAADFPDIEFEDLIIDNMAMQMVMNPQQFDVIVTTNLFGDILSDLSSGLVGGLGVTGAANVGDSEAIYEAVHGSAPDIAGRDKANPLGLLFASLMMLEDLDEHKTAEKIRKAVFKTLNDKTVCTPDIGGEGTTETLTDSVCQNL